MNSKIEAPGIVLVIEVDLEGGIHHQYHCHYEIVLLNPKDSFVNDPAAQLLSDLEPVILVGITKIILLSDRIFSGLLQLKSAVRVPRPELQLSRMQSVGKKRMHLGPAFSVQNV